MPREETDSFQKAGGKRVLVVPYDYRIPKIRIVTAQAKKLSRERIVVRIDNWPVNSAYPNGHFVRTLGAIGELETEMDGILVENDITITPFSKGMLAEMPVGEGWKPDPEEVARRKDLRKSHLVMSIDPKGPPRFTPTWFRGVCQGFLHHFQVAKTSTTRCPSARSPTGTSSWACTSPT